LVGSRKTAEVAVEGGRRDEQAKAVVVAATRGASGRATTGSAPAPETHENVAGLHVWPKD
jgi:hypothetical protein